MISQQLASAKIHATRPEHPAARDGGDLIDVMHLDPITYKKVSDLTRLIVKNNEAFRTYYDRRRMVPANPTEWHAHIDGSVKRIQEFVSRPVEMEKVSIVVTEILRAIRDEVRDATSLTMAFDSMEDISLAELLQRMTTIQYDAQMNSILDKIFKAHFGTTISSGFLKVYVMMCKGVAQIRMKESERLGVPEERLMDPSFVKPMCNLRLLALSIRMLTAVSDFVTAMIVINWPWHPRIFKKMVDMFDIVQNKNKVGLEEFGKKMYNQIQSYFLESYKQLPIAHWRPFDKLAQKYNIDEMAFDSSDDDNEENNGMNDNGGGEQVRKRGGKRKRRSANNNGSGSSRADSEQDEQEAEDGAADMIQMVPTQEPQASPPPPPPPPPSY